MYKPKIILLIFTAILLAINTFAQYSNLVLFTQANEPFFVIMNGIQQLPTPETNVKITGLKAPNYKVKIIFENKTIPEIDKTIYVQEETEVTCEILKSNKGKWVVRLLSSVPVDEIAEQPVGQDIYVFTTTPRTTTTVSQTTTISTGNMMGGASITTTTTQTTSNVEHHDDFDQKPHDYPEYSGPKGCPRPMNRRSFDQAIESISEKTFESSKLTIAKQIIGANCLLCQQVKEIMKQFTFESTRLELAKYAYKYTWDINNYYLLNDAFEFESSIDELNKYINGRR